MTAGWEIRHGDCLELMRDMPEGFARTCVTSPPYWGLRDYNVDGQIGLEKTPEEYTQRLVDVFREVRRVLTDDGTLWLNLGDIYAGAPGGWQGKNGQRASRTFTARIKHRKGASAKQARNGASDFDGPHRCGGALPPKNLVGIPWRVAFALQADGWILRSDIIWAKPNPMPESVRDRPTKSHEYMFLLSKSPRYYYDADAIREPYSKASISRYEYQFQGSTSPGRRQPGNSDERYKQRRDAMPNTSGRTRRTVWTVATQPYAEAHFAPFPPKLIEPCILAGSAPGDVVLDPFAGTGTTGLVACRNGRRFLGLDLNADYVAMARRRIEEDAPLFNGMHTAQP